MRDTGLAADEAVEGSTITISVSYKLAPAQESNAPTPDTPETLDMEELFVTF